ncbi:MAG TPA: phage holin family protein [Patescibacteria group bacterium]|nr:phage holin family protein [Patescibacteria group bacterium]
MRTIIKHFLITTVTLYIVSDFISGIKFAEGLYTILLAGFVLMLATLIVRPIINVLLLPINLITFGLFKWVTYAITLYLVTLVVPGFSIGSFFFKGLNSYWFVLPAISLSGVLAFIAFSFIISTISSLLYWIFK